MLRFPRRAVARFVALLHSDFAGVRAGFFALLISSGGDLVTGLTLASITHTLEDLPGLFILIPAAIGMRGNIFGALGSRLGTQIHAGTFRVSRRIDTLFGQNVGAAIVLSLSISAVLAVLAKIVSVAFAGSKSISIIDFMAISVIGAIISSVVVLVITVAVAAFCARRDLDLDNVAAPIVTAAGDIATLPSLFLATYLIGFQIVTPVIAVLCAVLAIGSLVVALRAGLPIMRRILLESLPVLVLAGTVDLLAGLTIEKRLESFLTFPALFVLVPAFLEDSGSLGAILAARISTKLHLGTMESGRGAWWAAIEDVMLIYVYAVPVFFFLGASSIVVSHIADKASPGNLNMMGVTLLAGLMATTAAVVVGFYSAVATYRFGLDPDNHGVPMVTSSLDFLGALSLILAIVILGLG